MDKVLFLFFQSWSQFEIWVSPFSPHLCHPPIYPHAEKSLLTQYEGAALCWLFSSQLRVLLRVVKLQWFHEGLKTSLALTMQNIQQPACSTKWTNKVWKTTITWNNSLSQAQACKLMSAFWCCKAEIVKPQKCYLFDVSVTYTCSYILQTWPWWMTGTIMS